MAIRDIVKLVVSIAICQGAGVAGSAFIYPAIDTWYPLLIKPSFTPPAWVFMPVWITLYLLMGVAFFLVWKTGVDHPKTKVAVLAFLSQLVLTVLWTMAFFGSRELILAFIIMLVLWAAVLRTMLLFREISRPAALLLVPYIAWLSFAVILYSSLLALNA